MAFVLVSLLASCTKDPVSVSEFNLTVSEITDSTAAVKCEFMPQKSVRYILTVCGKTLYSENTLSFTISHLAPGQKYSIVVTALDANDNEVEQKVVEFMTTGAPDNYLVYIEPSIEDLIVVEPFEPIIVIEDVTFVRLIDDTHGEVTIVTSAIIQSFDITVTGINDDYNQTQAVTCPDGKTKNYSTFTGLTCGNIYEIYANGEKLIGFKKSI